MLLKQRGGCSPLNPSPGSASADFFLPLSERLSVSFRSLNVSKLEMVAAGKDAGLALLFVRVAALLLTLLVVPTCEILSPHFGQKKYDFRSIQPHFPQRAAIFKHVCRTAKWSGKIFEPRPWECYLCTEI